MAMCSTNKRIAAVAIVAGASMAAAMSVPALASASGPPQLKVVKTLSKAYIGPLQFAVSGKSIYAADDFTSTLNKVGVATPIASNPGNGHDLAGVAVDSRTGAIAYTTSTAVGEEGTHTAAALTVIRPGESNLVVDLFAFEKSHNPDRITHYGVDHPSACVRKALAKIGAPPSYQGQLDTHPYGVAALGGGAWAVADAGGNDVLRVGPSGVVTTLAVLPRQPLLITKAFAKQNGLAKCTIGVTYNSEPVPTDVEVAPSGQLFVTTLPGGAGGPGKVYSLPSSTSFGQPSEVATGFAAATNLAIDSAGHIFVAELGSGQVAEVVDGHPVPVLSLPAVAGIEYANGHLYASTAPAALEAGGTNGAPPKGSIVLLGDK